MLTSMRQLFPREDETVEFGSDLELELQTRTLPLFTFTSNLQLNGISGESNCGELEIGGDVV